MYKRQFVGRYTENKWKSIAFAALGMVLGTMVLYALGTAWLAYSAGMDFQAALWAGVIPFIPGDLVKMVIEMCIRDREKAAEKAPKQKKKDCKADAEG